MHSYLIVVYYALSVEIDIVVMASIKPQHSADVTRDTNVSYSSITLQSMVLKVFSNNLNSGFAVACTLLQVTVYISHSAQNPQVCD